MARNEQYRRYLDDLCSSSGKYSFDVNSDMFQSIYRDTVLQLDERGYLMDNDPELLSVHRAMKGLSQGDASLLHNNPLEAITIGSDEIVSDVHGGDYNPMGLKEEDDTHSEEELEYVGCLLFFQHVDS